MASALITFDAPLNNGGSPITSYHVATDPVTTVFVGNASPILVDGLQGNGSSYTFTVTAINAIGESAPSAPSNVLLVP